MSDVLNINAVSGRNIIEDGTTPALTLENTSSGSALTLQNAGGTGVQLSTLSCPTTSVYVTGAAGGLDVLTVGTPGTFRSSASAANAIDLKRTVLDSATVALAKFTASTASTPAFQFAGSLIQSTASGTASLVAGVRVKFGDTYGWIPVMVNIA